MWLVQGVMLIMSSKGHPRSAVAVIRIQHSTPACLGQPAQLAIARLPGLRLLSMARTNFQLITAGPVPAKLATQPLCLHIPAIHATIRHRPLQGMRKKGLLILPIVSAVILPEGVEDNRVY